MNAEPQRFVLGIAYQAGPDPRIKRGLDGGRDYFSKEELERACWSYMRSGCPQINAFHIDGTEDCAEPVESFIWRWPDWDVGDGIVVKDGDWCLGAILSPRMWELHKQGKVNGLSPEGTAQRRRVRKDGAMAFAKGSAFPMEDDGDEDEFNELFNANVPKVALVGHGANGIPRFLLTKQDSTASPALVDPDFVRQLIAKAEVEDPAATHPQEMVTVTATPAAMAALIHGAPVRKADPDDYQAFCKAKYDTADRKHMAGTGAAMDDGSYPIADGEDLERAIRAVGRGGAGHDAIRRHIISRARSLGMSSKIPDNWGADGSLKKALGGEMDEVLDPTVVLADPEEGAPGNPAEPGSPAWEAVDAATARKWTAILSRAKTALEVMSDRENLEAAGADPDDAEAACDLQDAACAVDYALSILAPFAVDEQAKADCPEDAMGMIGKALGAFDTAPLEVIESLTQVRKAGRVLSAANEEAIRGAVESLQKVLASLPQAPTADTDGGQAVAKTANEEPDMDTPTPTENVTADSGQAPAMGAATTEPKPVAGAAVTEMTKSAPTVDEIVSRLAAVLAPAPLEPATAQVIKADKTPQVAIYDAHGNLVGTVDPAEITMLAPAKAPEASDEPKAEPAEAAAPPADLAPAPAAEVGTPADGEMAKSSADNAADRTTETVLKGSDITALVKAALDEYSAGQADLVKELKDQNVALEERNTELIKTTAELAERLAVVENQPAVMAIASHGAVPPREMLRGQDQGIGTAHLTKGQDLRRQLAAAPDAATQERIKKQMNELAIEQLSAIHQQGAR